MKTLPHMKDAAPQLAKMADEALRMALDWADPKEEGRDGPRSAGLLDSAADCFLYPQTPRLRLSMGAVCERQQWYHRWRPDLAVPDDGAGRLVMVGGYVFEKLFLEALGGYMEKFGGPWRMERGFAQKDLALDVGGEKITGHPDCALLYEGQPYAIGDCKSTSSSALAYWKDERFPDALWGKPHQAGNYLKAEPREFPYFIWWLSLRDFKGNHERAAIGWATRAELMPYATEAEKIWLKVIQSPNKPLPRINPDSEGAPCRNNKTVWCKYQKHCKSGMDLR